MLKRLTLRKSTQEDHGLMPRAVSILQELTQAYTESGVGVHFAHLRPAHMSLFELVGIAEQVSVASEAVNGADQ